MGHCAEHGVAEVDEIPRLDGLGGEVGAGRAQYRIIKAVLDGQYPEDAVGAADKLPFLGGKSAFAPVGDVSPDDDANGDREYDE